MKVSKIKFHDPDVEDYYDWKVKGCYTLLIAALSEVECGIKNLWMCGTGNDRRDRADFGRYVPRDAFKAFCSVAPYAYCHQRYWYVDKRDRPWDIFLKQASLEACPTSHLNQGNLFHLVQCLKKELNVSVVPLCKSGCCDGGGGTAT